MGSGMGKGVVDFRKNDLLEVTVTKPEHDIRWESRKVLSYVNLQSPLKEREIKELVLSRKVCRKAEYRGRESGSGKT